MTQSWRPVSFFTAQGGHQSTESASLLSRLPDPVEALLAIAFSNG